MSKKSDIKKLFLSSFYSILTIYYTIKVFVKEFFPPATSDSSAFHIPLNDKSEMMKKWYKLEETYSIIFDSKFTC